jgi:hypothetical protein
MDPRMNPDHGRGMYVAADNETGPVINGDGQTRVPLPPVYRPPITKRTPPPMRTPPPPADRGGMSYE